MQGLAVSRTGSFLHVLHSLDSLLGLQCPNRNSSAISKELFLLVLPLGCVTHPQWTIALMTSTVSLLYLDRDSTVN